MKKVVKDQIEQINDDSIIGIEWPENDRSIIIYDGDFLSFGNEDKSIEETWKASSIKEYVEECLEIDMGIKIFQFESVKECLKWMSE